MADRPEVKTRRITRDKLASFLKSHELIKAFEDLAADVSETLPDAIMNATADTGSVLAFASFARPIPPVPLPVDAASQVLASQIFGA